MTTTEGALAWGEAGRGDIGVAGKGADIAGFGTGLTGGCSGLRCGMVPAGGVDTTTGCSCRVVLGADAGAGADVDAEGAGSGLCVAQPAGNRQQIHTSGLIGNRSSDKSDAFMNGLFPTDG